MNEAVEDNNKNVGIKFSAHSDEPTKSTEYTSRAVNTGISFYCLVYDWMSEMNERL
jgi:hypothetical protein